MKKQIQQYLAPLDIDGNKLLTETPPIFSIHRKNKYLVGKLEKDDKQQPILQIYSSNYSKPYAKRMLKNGFQESGLNLRSVEMFSRLSAGDIIVSNELYGSPDENEELTLPYNFEYAGVYNMFIRCNAESLGSDWDVVYIGYKVLTCNPGEYESLYHLYELVKEL